MGTMCGKSSCAICAPEPHGVSGTLKLSIPGRASGHWGTPAAAADFLARALAPPRLHVLRD